MVTISVDLTPELVRVTEQLVKRGAYASRSELVREALRRFTFWKAWEVAQVEVSRLGLTEREGLAELKRIRAARHG